MVSVNNPSNFYLRTFQNTVTDLTYLNLTAVEYININNVYYPIAYVFSNSMGQGACYDIYHLNSMQLPQGFSVGLQSFLTPFGKYTGIYTLHYNGTPILNYANSGVNINFQYLDYNTLENGVNDLVCLLDLICIYSQEQSQSIQTASILQTQEVVNESNSNNQSETTEITTQFETSDSSALVTEAQQDILKQTEQTPSQSTQTQQTEQIQQTATTIQQDNILEEFNPEIPLPSNVETQGILDAQTQDVMPSTKVYNQKPTSQVTESISVVEFGSTNTVSETVIDEIPQEVSQPIAQDMPQNTEQDSNQNIFEQDGLKFGFLDGIPNMDFDHFSYVTDKDSFKSIGKSLPVDTYQRLYLYLTKGVSEDIIDTFWGLLDAQEKWALARLVIIEGDVEKPLWGNLAPYLWLYKQSLRFDLDVTNDQAIEYKLLDRYLKSTLKHTKQNVSEIEEDEDEVSSDSADITLEVDKKSPEWKQEERFIQDASSTLSQCQKPEDMTILEAICTGNLDTSNLGNLIGIPNVSFSFSLTEIRCSYFGTEMCLPIIFKILSNRKDYQVRYLAEIAYQIINVWSQISYDLKQRTFTPNVYLTHNGMNNLYPLKEALGLTGLPFLTADALANIHEGEIVNHITANLMSYVSPRMDSTMGNLRLNKSPAYLMDIINSMTILYSIAPADTLNTEEEDPRLLYKYISIAQNDAMVNMQEEQERLAKGTYNNLLSKTKLNSNYATYDQITLLESLDLKPKYVIIGVNGSNKAIKPLVVGIVYYNEKSISSFDRMLFIPSMGNKLFDAFLSDNLQVQLPNMCKAVGQITLPTTGDVVKILRAQPALANLSSSDPDVKNLKVSLEVGDKDCLNTMYYSLYKGINSSNLLLPSWVKADEENVNKALIGLLQL